MKKSSSYILSFLLVATLIVPTAANASTTSNSPDLSGVKGVEAVSKGQLLVDESDLVAQQDKILDFLNIHGNSVTVYGLNLNKDQIYSVLLKDQKVPRLTSVGSEDLNDKGRSVDKPDPIEHSSASGEGAVNFDTVVDQNSRSISTDLTIVNNNGEFFIIDGKLTIPKESEKLLTKDKLKRALSEKMESEVGDFKATLNEQNTSQLVAVAAETTPTSNLGSVRIKNWFYDDSLFYDLDTFQLAETVTDYLLLKSVDEDSSYDYITVKALTTWYPTYDNRDIINGIQGTIDNYYTNDTLLDYYPNTGSVDSQLSNNTQYQIGIGYPWAATAAVTWQSGATAKLQAKGDRSTGRYYEFFYGTNWGVYNSIGSGDPVDSTYTATYKSAGTLLKLYVTSSVRHQWFNESTNEWKDVQEVLTWDY